MEWNQWCRLCGEENGNQINIFFKNENLFDIAETIQRFFSIEIMNTEESAKYICISCNEYLLSLHNYAEKVDKIQQLFIEIESNFKTGAEIDVNELRLKYNLQVALSNVEQFEVESFNNHEIVICEENKVSLYIIENDSIDKENHNNMSDYEINVGRTRIDQANPDVKQQDSPTSFEHEKQNDYKLKNSNKKRSRTPKAPIDNLNSEDDTNSIDNDYNDNTSDSLETLPSEIVKVDKAKQCIKKSYKINEKKFKCKECHQKFTKESSLLSHITKSHKCLPPCKFCGKICKTKQKLKLHLELHLPPEEREKLLYKCPHCDRKYSQSARVEEHVRAIHLQEKPYVCEQCGKSFATQTNFRIHKRTHDNQSRLTCSLCPKIFNNLHKLRYHIRHTHSSTGHLCYVCDKVLKTRRTLRNHMLIHSDAKPFKCNYCGKDFKRDRNLQIHMIRHSGLKPFGCRFCTQLFVISSNCKKHEMDSHPNEYEAAASVTSSEPQQKVVKKLPNIQQLEAMLEQIKSDKENNIKNHTLMHSDAKPFKCNYCGKDFKRDKNLQIHMILHSGLKPFGCRFCTQSYANRLNCKKHEKHSHPNEHEAAASVTNSEPKQKIVIPSIQQLEAMLEQIKSDKGNNIENHSLMHTNAKPFKCNYCGKDFQRGKNLQIHMILHSGLKPFGCRFCAQSYANSLNCKKHEKHSHPNEYEAADAVTKSKPLQKVVIPSIQELEAMLEQIKSDKEITDKSNKS